MFYLKVLSEKSPCKTQNSLVMFIYTDKNIKMTMIFEEKVNLLTQ